MEHSDKKPVRILALHGYRQNNDALRRPLERLLKPRPNDPPVEMVYATAPVLLHQGSDLQGSDKQQELRAWWNRPTFDLCEPFAYDTFGEACEAVVEAIGDRPIDALVGFSQGAVMGTLLLQKGLLPECKRVLLYGASGVQDPILAATLPRMGSERVSALVMHGVKDTLCTMEDARRLGSFYDRVEYGTHRWGHLVPSDTANRNRALDFVLSLQQ